MIASAFCILENTLLLRTGENSFTRTNQSVVTMFDIGEKAHLYGCIYPTHGYYGQMRMSFNNVHDVFVCFVYSMNCTRRLPPHEEVAVV